MAGEVVLRGGDVDGERVIVPDHVRTVVVPVLGDGTDGLDLVNYRDTGTTDEQGRRIFLLDE